MPCHRFVKVKLGQCFQVLLFCVIFKNRGSWKIKTIMNVALNDAIDVLHRTPSVLNSLLLDLPDSWTRTTEGEDSWSPFDVVGHLVHAEETDWIPRLQIILDDGEARTFDTFDRNAQFKSSVGKSLADLLIEFSHARALSLTTLAEFKLTDSDLQKTGTHPEFGRVTLGELMATWVVHDLSHIAQIGRVMCKQYAESVGPWRAYLPILKR